MLFALPLAARLNTVFLNIFHDTRAAIPWIEIPFVEFCYLARANDFLTLRKKEHENDEVTHPLEKLYEVVCFVTRRRDR